MRSPVLGRGSPGVVQVPQDGQRNLTGACLLHATDGRASPNPLCPPLAPERPGLGQEDHMTTLNKTFYLRHF